VATLRTLQVAHLRRVPFENLDIHLGVPIDLDPDALVDKVTTRHRGGFCYELNGALAVLLEELGFGVERLEARVIGDDGEPGIPFDHLVLRVEAEGQPFLVDVGFGENFDEPLPFVTGVDHVDPVGTFRIEARDDGSYELLQEGEPQHRFWPTPRVLADFADGCAFHQTSPDSHFTSGPVCTLRTPSGRMTLRRRQLIRTMGAERDEREVPAGDLRQLYADRFGISLTADEAARLA
jgi:N-hydroxyarylamine O-acetyltransferase